MKYFVLLLFMALAGETSSCQKAAATPDGVLTTSFQLLNEQGQEATVFSHGQNLIFRFQLTNPSDQDVVLHNPPIEVTHFLEVNRLTPGEGSGAMGKPYDNIFCYLTGGIVVQAHTTTTLSIAWVETPAFPTSLFFCGHAKTTYLPAGRYRTSFTTPLIIIPDQPNQVTKAQTFTKEFEVK
jgi:hypothetical protein